MAPDDPVADPAATRGWSRTVSIVALVGVTVPLVVIFALVGPYLRDDRRLDHAVRAVALDWRDFGDEAALTRLQYELDHQKIGLQVGDDDCRFEREDGGSRLVRCEWEVDVVVPVAGWTWPLSFESEARVTPDGALQ